MLDQYLSLYFTSQVEWFFHSPRAWLRRSVHLNTIKCTWWQPSKRTYKNLFFSTGVFFVVVMLKLYSAKIRAITVWICSVHLPNEWYIRLQAISNFALLTTIQCYSWMISFMIILVRLSLLSIDCKIVSNRNHRCDAYQVGLH